ncbi:hypothetical protein ACWCOP_10490 [Maricaulaceae bacterium MS644]
MTPMRILALTALSAVLAACGSEPSAEETEVAAASGAQAPSTDTAPAPASDDLSGGVPADDAALHALLLANSDDIVPSVWRTGEPAPDTALAYWMLPEIDVNAERSAACAPMAELERAQECTLTFVSIPEEGAEERPVTARYRFTVQETAEGEFTLLSPNVRWAVQG